MPLAWSKSAFSLLKSGGRGLYLGAFGVRLSLSQQAILAAERLEPGLSCFVMTRAWDFGAHLDDAAFARALARLVQRHDALRMTVTWHRADYVARFHKKMRRKPRTDKVSATDPAKIEVEIDRRVTELALRPLPAIDAPLWDVRILNVSPERSVVCFRFHHLIGDDWSLALLKRDLFALYAEETGVELAGLPAPGRFKTCLCGANAAADKSVPDGKTPPQRPDFSFSRDAKAGGKRGVVARRAVRALTRGEGAALAAKSGAVSLTPFAFAAAAFNIVISRNQDQPDTVLSLSVSRRNSLARENTLGCLTDVLNLATQWTDTQSFVELATRVQNGVRAFEQSRTSEPAQNVVTFSFYNAPELHNISWPFKITQRDVPERALFSHLHFGVQKTKGAFKLVLEGRRGSFDAEPLERIADCFIFVLKQALENPEIRIGDIRLIAPEEEARLAALSTNLADQPLPFDIPTRFDEIANEHRGEPALVAPEGSWSYGELDLTSLRLAHWLRRAPMSEGAIVGIALPRGARLVITTLAAFRAGLVVVPLDTEYPTARLVELCKSAGVTAILSDGQTPDDLRDVAPQINVPAPDDLPEVLHDQPIELRNKDPERPAYIIFTSGTTGKPKGIPTPHRAVVRMTVNSARCPAGPGDRLVQITSTGFDVSFDEIWGAWLNGAELVVTNENLLSEGNFAARFCALRPTIASLTARLLDVVAQTDPCALSSLNYLSTGGELVSFVHIAKVMAANPQLRIFNCYGPAENTGVTTCYQIRRDHFGPVPIGRPLQNFRAFVLTDNLLPVPVGFAGELCVGGPGLSHGYLNRDEETKRKFVTVPAYSLGLDQKGSIRLYRTGDRARWNEDDQLEFLGRKDSQFKVNGYRIESAEIETALLAQPGVSGAVVEPDLRPSEQTPSGIIAFVASENDITDEASLRQNLAHCLPRPALPTRYLFVASIPRNQNGKADRAALRLLAQEALVRPAGTPLPKDRLVTIWQDLLGRSVLGEDADFFALGGSSLSVVRMVARVENAYHCSLDLTDVLTDARLCTLRGLIRVAQQIAPPFARHLVRLRRGDKRQAPIVFVHAMYGGLAWCNDLIEDWPAPNALYGLTFIRREDHRWRPRDLKTLVADFVEDLVGAFEGREFHLVGYSSGGLISLALYNAARKAGLKIGKVFVIDTDLRLMEYEPQQPGTGPSPKDSLARVMTAARVELISSEIHYLSCTHAFETPNKRLAEDWASVTEDRVLIYDFKTDHTDIIKPPFSRKLTQKMHQILSGEAQADRIQTGASSPDVLNIRQNAREQMLAGNPEAAISLLKTITPGPDAPWVWYYVSMLRLYRGLKQTGGEKLELEQEAKRSQNPLVLNEIARNSKTATQRRAALRALMDASGEEMLGAIRLTDNLCRKGDLKEAGELSDRVSDNKAIAPAGIFTRAVVSRFQGNREAMREAVCDALSDDRLKISHLRWILNFLKDADEVQLAQEAVGIGRTRFPEEF